MNTHTIAPETIFASEHLPKFKEWAETRGGILSWINEEIASSQATEVFTPALTTEGKPYPSPGWRYPTGKLVDLATAKVRTFVPTAGKGFKGRSKAFYWGLGLLPVTEAKAKRLCADGETFQYTFDYPNVANVEIGKEELQPFPL